MTDQNIAARFFTASEHHPVVRLRDRIIALAREMRGNRGLFAPEEYR